MICSVHTLGITGIQGSPVVAECYISNGLPGFDIVGLPDAAVKEARERVRAAAKKRVRSMTCLFCSVSCLLPAPYAVHGLPLLLSAK